MIVEASPNRYTKTSVICENGSGENLVEDDDDLLLRAKDKSTSFDQAVNGVRGHDEV
jgi:hypothetical protein